MEEPSEIRFDHIKNAVRKKRTPIFRRPRPESQPYREYNECSPMSSTPSDDTGKVSSDDAPYMDLNPKRKEFSLSQCMSRAPSISEPERENAGRTSNSKRSTEGVLAPANWRSTNRVTEGMEVDVDDTGAQNERSNGSTGIALETLGNESRVRKVKLKVGGVTRTLHTNSTGMSCVQSSDDLRSQLKQNRQSNSQESIPSQDRAIGLRGIPWKDFSSARFCFGREDPALRKGSRKFSSGKQSDQPTPVRKSKRVPKRRSIDADFDEDDDDEEIRYLEKLKNKSAALNNEDDEESGRKQRQISRVMENLGSSRSGRGAKKKFKMDGGSEDTDYEQEDYVASDDEPDGLKKRKQKKESVECLMENKREIALTTRQRAIQSSKDASSVPVSSVIEFPNGLPPPPSRKPKEKLSEVEQQLKKAEAAQRRKMQNEKAARESEAEAIRKILGQDSNRKKREEKIKKRQEELAQEKVAKEEMLSTTCIRTVMGPTGTIVSFPKDFDLPTVFTSKPISYPPPREKCAGPNCTNSYKYRDSKSHLPLCSLQCYKAIQKPLET